MEVAVPTRVCVKGICLRNKGYEDFLDWVSRPRNIYIGRFNRHVKGTVKSKWHNPFPLGDLNLKDCLLLFTYVTRSNYALMDSIIELDGKHLRCFCRLLSEHSYWYAYTEPTCHGSILINLFQDWYNIPDIVPEGGKVMLRGSPQNWVQKNREKWVQKNEMKNKNYSPS